MMMCQPSKVAHIMILSFLPALRNCLAFSIGCVDPSNAAS